MTKLNKRQLIIIGIAVIALFYGAYALFSGGKGQKNAGQGALPGQNQYMSSITGDLMKNTFNIVDSYIIVRAEADWERDPFWERSFYKEWAGRDAAKTAEDPAAKIIYSGYIDVGKKKMAVINGLEYSVGEQLEAGNYVLKKITASRVLISNRDTASELEIRIQE